MHCSMHGSNYYPVMDNITQLVRSLPLVMTIKVFMHFEELMLRTCAFTKSNISR